MFVMSSPVAKYQSLRNIDCRFTVTCKGTVSQVAQNSTSQGRSNLSVVNHRAWITPLASRNSTQLRSISAMNDQIRNATNLMP